jgi:hypothetical protein
MDARGRATVAWSLPIAGSDIPQIRAAVAKPGRPFGTGVAVGRGLVGNLAVMGPDGTTALAWTGGPNAVDDPAQAEVLVATSDPTTGTFEPGHTVSDLTSSMFFRPRVALDPATGRPAVLWAHVPEDVDPGVYELRFSAAGS